MSDKRPDTPVLFFGLSALQSVVLATCTIFTIMFVPRDFNVVNLPGNLFVGLVVWSVLLAACLRANWKYEKRLKTT